MNLCKETDVKRSLWVTYIPPTFPKDTSLCRYPRPNLRSIWVAKWICPVCLEGISFFVLNARDKRFYYFTKKNAHFTTENFTISQLCYNVKKRKGRVDMKNFGTLKIIIAIPVICALVGGWYFLFFPEQISQETVTESFEKHRGDMQQYCKPYKFPEQNRTFI